MREVFPYLFHIVELHLSKAIELSIKDLLENKHLYQNLDIPFPSYEEIIEDLKNCGLSVGFSKREFEEIQYIIDSVNEICWIINDPIQQSRLPLVTNNPTKSIPSISFELPTVRIFCPVCRSIEPFNYIHGYDVTKDIRLSKGSNNTVENQVFVLAYECQSCKDFPEVFLLRRIKTKLILSGRTLIEQFDVPKFIPKSQGKYYSGAIIAFNSGQILAGKFLLRTFIEQYIRDFSNDRTTQDMDTLFEKYGSNLPKGFKDSFPLIN